MLAQTPHPAPVDVDDEPSEQRRREQRWNVSSAGPDASERAEASALSELVASARHLLDYAVGQGLVDSPTIVEAIIGIERQLKAGAQPEAPVVIAFLKAYCALRKATGEVSADSLGAAARRNQQKTRRFYFLCLFPLLLLTIPLTTIATVGGHLASDAASQIEATCKSYPVLYCDPATKNIETTYDLLPYARTDLASRTSRISQDLWALAYLVDLLQPGDLHRELASLSPKRLDDNVWSLFLENFARSGTVIGRFQLYYGTLSSYLLPILFGMLGAVAFGLRELRLKTEPPTWGRHGGAMAVQRIVTAGLAGYLVTVAGDLASASTLSPIMIAFVLGYSIDVFFMALDKIVAQLKAITLSPATDRASGRPLPRRG